MFKFLVAEQPSTIKPNEQGNHTHRYDGGLSLGCRTHLQTEHI